MTAVVAWAPCTWGELVQGTVDGVDVLLTCPVDRFAVALARPAGPGAPAPWHMRPEGRRKALQALHLLPPPPWPVRVRLRTPLRPGAGCATSTADLCAALAAAAALQGRRLTPAELFALCLAVEPSDGLMFPGLALVDHRRGTYAASLGPPPPLAILGLDPGGTVDTLAFNGRPDLAAANRRKEPLVREALDLARRAIAAGDPAGLAAAATLSARAHQALLPNPLWEPAQAWARATGALGICVAHSGVVLGLLYDPRRADVAAAAGWLAQASGLPVHRLRLVAGGVMVQAYPALPSAGPGSPTQPAASLLPPRSPSLAPHRGSTRGEP